MLALRIAAVLIAVAWIAVAIRVTRALGEGDSARPDELMRACASIRDGWRDLHFTTDDGPAFSLAIDTGFVREGDILVAKRSASSTVVAIVIDGGDVVFADPWLGVTKQPIAVFARAMQVALHRPPYEPAQRILIDRLARAAVGRAVVVPLRPDDRSATAPGRFVRDCLSEAGIVRPPWLIGADPASAATGFPVLRTWRSSAAH